MSDRCSIGDCDRPADRHHDQLGPICSGHRKRTLPSRAGRVADPMRPLRKRLSPLERLREAALQYADATSDRDFERAETRLKDAAKGFVRSLHGAMHSVKRSKRARSPAPTPVGILRLFPRRTLLTAELPPMAAHG